MLKILAFCVAVLSLVGCGDTRQAIEQMHREAAEGRVAGAKALATRLKADPNVSGQGDIQIFLSSDLLRQILGIVSGFSIQLPEHPDVTVTLVSAVPALSEGVAAVDLKLQARRGDVQFDVEGVATLLPEPLKPGRLEVQIRNVEVLRLFGSVITVPMPETKFIKPEPMKFKLIVERLAPNARWGPFSSEIKGFVAEFAQLKLNQELGKRLPPIEVPIENLIKIDQGAQQKNFEIAEGAYSAVMTTPPVAWAVTFGLQDFIVLPRGIHLIGKFENPKGTL
ncbi:hypothetical protein [Acidovorax sp.]|uniref:hypothetical protein n=1 Tax=Acidovorax sp. TaxID=1872122 RepID=UPI00391F1AF7